MNTFKFNQAQFFMSKPQEELQTLEITLEAKNRIVYYENKVKYVMGCTKTDGNKSYYGCLNRFHAASSSLKCGGTGIYDSKTGIYTPRKPHTALCGTSSSNFTISDSYTIQRNFIHQELEKNPRLTVSVIQGLLTKENLKKSPSKRSFPLNYDQIKHIIEVYRQDNGIKNKDLTKEMIILTRDNALFLRYNSTFIGYNKGNFF